MANLEQELKSELTFAKKLVQRKYPELDKNKVRNALENLCTVHGNMIDTYPVWHSLHKIPHTTSVTDKSEILLKFKNHIIIGLNKHFNDDEMEAVEYGVNGGVVMSDVPWVSFDVFNSTPDFVEAFGQLNLNWFVFSTDNIEIDILAISTVLNDLSIDSEALSENRKVLVGYPSLRKASVFLTEGDYTKIISILKILEKPYESKKGRVGRKKAASCRKF